MGIVANFMYCLIGSAFILGFLLPKKKSYSYESTLANSVVLLAVVNVVVDLGAKMGYGEKSLQSYRILALLILFFVFHHKKDQFYELVKLDNYYPILSSLTLTIWVFIPPLKILASRQLSWGMASMGNNDLPFYADVAKFVSTTGYANPGPITNLQNFGGGWISDFSYHGVTALINFVQFVTGISAWQATYPAFALGVYLFCLAVITLCLKSGVSKKLSFLITAVVVNLPIMSYQIAQGFFGYILGFGFIIASIALFPWKPNLEKVYQKVTLSALSLTCAIYSYPHIGVTFLMLSLVIYGFCLFLKLKKDSGGAFIDLKKLILFVSVVSTAVYPIKSNLFLLISSINGADSAGWTLLAFNPLSIVITSSSINKKLPHITLILLWVVYFLILLLITNLVEKKYKRIFALFALVIHLTGLLLSLNYGIESYKAWKILGWLIPIFVLGSLIMLYRRKKQHNSILLALVFCSVVNPFSTWSAGFPGSLPTATTKDVELLHSGKFLNDKIVLNIQGRTMWESMEIAAALDNPHVYVMGTSYFKDSINGQISSCSLIPLSLIPIEQIPISKISNFAVIATPRGCRYVL